VPRKGWKNLHTPVLFTPVYKARVMDLNFVPQRMKMHQKVTY